MSEKLEIIVPEAIVNIRMSTGYYQKVQELMQFLIEGKDKDAIAAAYKQIADKNITEPWVEQLQTTFILIKDFQNQAKNEGFVKSMTKEEAEDYLKDKFPEVKD